MWDMFTVLCSRILFCDQDAFISTPEYDRAANDPRASKEHRKVEHK